jgi:hypothetical protein
MAHDALHRACSKVPMYRQSQGGCFFCCLPLAVLLGSGAATLAGLLR